MRLRWLVPVVVLLSTAFLFGDEHKAKDTKQDPPAKNANGAPAPRFFRLGKHHHPITTKSPEAQKYFDQGLILAYGFNHHEAARSFEAVTKLDPDCAMGYWGVALVLGPNINAPMSPDVVPRAWEMLQMAKERAAKAGKKEQALIAALEKRYGPKPVDDRSGMDRAYAEAMAGVWKQFPDDTDVATLYAEALMDTMPWNYYEEKGKPRRDTDEVIRALEFAMQKEPLHPGANHLYIHAVEASSTPERGLGAAHRLGNVAPDAGHLVHMPSHIYLRLGMYHEGVLTNQRAVRSDESYVTQCKAQGFYPTAYYSHNAHFLWYCLSMEGRSAECLRAGRLSAHIPGDMAVHQMAVLQIIESVPIQTLVRFGRWDEILKQPAPDEKMLLVRGMWHYARAVAHVRQGRRDEAVKEAAALQKLLDSKEGQALETDQFPGTSLLRIADTIVDAELLGLDGDTAGRVAGLEQAVALQDKLAYMEPPYWYYPVRHTLGAALLDAGKLKEAERVYRTDLRKNPENGWSLFGLLQSLRRQGKDAEARAVERRFREAWKHADTALTSSGF